MRQIDDFYKKFREMADSLPYDVQLLVLEALGAENHRLAYLALNNLWLKNKLPSEWGELLQSFYSRFY